MTIKSVPQHPGRPRPTAAHVYTIPIVRELPSPRVEIFDTRTW